MPRASTWCRLDVIRPKLARQNPLGQGEHTLRLVLSWRRNARRDSKVSEESCNLPDAHFTRVPLVVEEAEAPHPVAVGLLRPHAIVLEPDAVTELIEQQQLRRSGEHIDAIADNFSGRESSGDNDEIAW